VASRISASERTGQLDELLTQGVADGDARAGRLKLAARKIVGGGVGGGGGRGRRAGLLRGEAKSLKRSKILGTATSEYLHSPSNVTLLFTRPTR